MIKFDLLFLYLKISEFLFMVFLISSALFSLLIKASESNSTFFSNDYLSFNTSFDLSKLFGFNLEILLVNSSKLFIPISKNIWVKGLLSLLSKIP